MYVQDPDFFFGMRIVDFQSWVDVVLVERDVVFKC